MNKIRVKQIENNSSINPYYETIISFSPETKWDSELFQKGVWPQFYNIIHARNENRIIFDLNNVVFINPQVLPKLCCLGVIAKRCGKRVELVFNPVSKIKEYLGQMDFFEINKKHDFFYIDEGLIGGELREAKLNKTFLVFDKSEIDKKYNNLYSFSPKVNESDRLRYCLRGEIFGCNNMLSLDEYCDRIFKESPVLNILKEFYSGDIKNNYELIKEIGLNFVDIVHNSLWHGKSKCFLAMQVAEYSRNNKKFTRVDISFSDYGLGMYQSLCAKDWTENNKATYFIPLEQFLSLRNEDDQDYYSSLEAILYRRNERMRGLYDVFSSLLGKEPKVAILNRNSLIQLNERKIRQLLEMNRNGIKAVRLDNIGFGFGIDISFYV